MKFRIYDYGFFYGFQYLNWRGEWDKCNWGLVETTEWLWLARLTIWFLRRDALKEQARRSKDRPTGVLPY